ncbi:MAG: sensor histidine kinase [Flavobacteriaceae bacterium]|jgi:signal transduction histidine kinase|nr:sensor histidine kinase [Flavobacteriaceae bacterium]
MKFLKNIRLTSWLSYIITVLVVGGVIFVSNEKVAEMKKEESQKISDYAKILEILNNETDISSKVEPFLVSFIEQNTTIPVILVDEKGELIDSKNIAKEIIRSPAKLKKTLDKMKSQYPPIRVSLPFGNQYVYYQNSLLLNQLEYYPIVLVIVIALMIWFTYWYFKTLRKTEQSLLWAGMAKETAHQIGTPLSSIMGWVEILKIENIDQKPIQNIERDINRLQNITDRFSKIGSVPTLAETDVVSVTIQSLEYLKNRVSKQINFDYDVPSEAVNIQLNTPLYGWVIENLTKNAVDAMRNEGNFSLKIQDNKKKVYIDLSDDGAGLASKNIKKIFYPGVTTKKRGWGLGLSLAKRIIEDYHHGKIFVLNTELKKGTTFRIVLKK